MAATRRTPRSPIRSAAILIRLARRHAAALFNGGLREASVGVYEAAARALLASGQNLPAASRRDLREALRDARRLRTPSARAWRLGTTLDRVASALRGEPTGELILARVGPTVPPRNAAR